MARNSKSFRVGRVRGDLRGRVWYLSYSDQGQRHRPRVGSDRNAARQLAAKINAELEAGVTTTLAFQAIRFSELRQQRLQFHEQIARSSVASISRYRTATELQTSSCRRMRSTDLPPPCRMFHETTLISSPHLSEG
ncbi:MAG: hypothetical protein KDA90_09195 [Planctomycetaceae bacterium]|nr:hypothetical protein [Planctomycetaceae bacterium]